MKIWGTFLAISAVGLGRCGSPKGGPGNPPRGQQPAAPANVQRNPVPAGGTQAAPQNGKLPSTQPGMNGPVGQVNQPTVQPTQVTSQPPARPQVKQQGPQAGAQKLVNLPAGQQQPVVTQAKAPTAVAANKVGGPAQATQPAVQAPQGTPQAPPQGTPKNVTVPAPVTTPQQGQAGPVGQPAIPQKPVGQAQQNAQPQARQEPGQHATVAQPGNPSVAVVQPPTTLPTGQGIGTHQPTVQAPVQTPVGQPAQSVSQAASRPGQQTHPGNTKPVTVTPQGTPNGLSKPAPAQGSPGVPQAGANKPAGQPAVHVSQPANPPQGQPANQGKQQQGTPQGTPQAAPKNATTPGPTQPVGSKPAPQHTPATPQVGAGQPATPATLQTGAQKSASLPAGQQPVSPKPPAPPIAPQVTTGKVEAPPADTPEVPAIRPHPTQPAKPPADVATKVDGNLFTTELGNDDGVPVLKLTAKTGATANKLTFDNKDVWTGRDQKDSCSEATFYFGSDNAPTVATFRFKNKDDKVVEGHCQFDGTTWTQAKKDDVQKKLNELKQSGAPLPPTSGVPEKLKNGTDQQTTQKSTVGATPDKPVQPTQVTSQVTSPSVVPEAQPTQPANPVVSGPTLNVTSVDGTMFTIQESKVVGQITKKTLTPKDDIKPTEVTEGSSSIWKAEQGEHAKSASVHYDGGAPILATVTYAKPDGKIVCRFYIKQDGTWTWVGKEEYDAKLREVAPLILDLANPESSICKSFDVNIQGTPAKVYAVFSGIDVTKIVHSGKSIWTSQGAESCFYCASFLKNGSPSVTAIRIKGQELSQSFCELKGESWNVSQDDNDKKINALKPANTDAPKKFSLDISATSGTNECKVTNESKNGTTARLYVPKPGHAIEKVVMGDKEVWKAEGGQLCYLCDYYAKTDFTLMRLHLESKYELSLLCYKKEASKSWVGISGKDFNELAKWSTGGSSKA